MSDRTTVFIFVMQQKIRELYFYKNYFKEFYAALQPGAQQKILWVLKLVEEVYRVPETYFKFIRCSDGIYEIRVQYFTNIYRIFCFFDNNNIVVVGNGFQKKSQKPPLNEIEKAIRIKNEYYEEKQKSRQP